MKEVSFRVALVAAGLSLKALPFFHDFSLAISLGSFLVASLIIALAFFYPVKAYQRVRA